MRNRELNDDDALNILLDDNIVYDHILEGLITNLQNQAGNFSLSVISIKCAAHTLQLAVKDALLLLAEEDRNVITLCREAAKFLRKVSVKNELRRSGMVCILPALDVTTRWSSTFLMVSNLTYQF